MVGKIKIALIGTGGIAESHVQGYKDNADDVEFVACVDVDAERVEKFAKEHGAKSFYTDAAKMLAIEKPQMVCIATPPAFHTSLSIQCMEAGAWVICEKPLCASLDEMNQILDAEKRTGMITSCLFQFRYAPSSAHIKKMIDDGRVGRPMVGTCETEWFRDQEYYDVPWRGKWENELGGPTMGHGIHLMDLFLYLMGPWVEVSAMLGRLDRAIEVEDISTVLIRFESGAMGTIVNSILSPRQESRLRLDFQRGTFDLNALYQFTNKDWDFTLGDVDDKDPKNQEALKEWEKLTDNRAGDHSFQITEMIANFRNKVRPKSSGVQAYDTIELLSAIYKSGTTGQVVKKGEIDPSDRFYSSIHGNQDLPEGVIYASNN